MPNVLLADHIATPFGCLLAFLGYQPNILPHTTMSEQKSRQVPRVSRGSAGSNGSRDDGSSIPTAAGASIFDDWGNRPWWRNQFGLEIWKLENRWRSPFQDVWNKKYLDFLLIIHCHQTVCVFNSFLFVVFLGERILPWEQFSGKSKAKGNPTPQCHCRPGPIRSVSFCESSP